VAEAGSGQGPVVILLHGFPDLCPGWHGQIPALVEAGYQVLAPNQRGYVGSDKPGDIAAYDLDERAHVIDLADQGWRATRATDRSRLGRIIAAWVAARRPDRVSRLALLNAPHPGVVWRYLRRHPSQIARSWYAALFLLPRLPEALLRLRKHELLFRSLQWTSLKRVFDDSDRHYLVRGWSQPGSLTAMLNYYRAAARRTESSLQIRISVPTLILFGRRDPTEGPGLVLASQAMCDDSRIVWLPDLPIGLSVKRPTRSTPSCCNC
jgi:epoxide hydrolase 4